MKKLMLILMIFVSALMTLLVTLSDSVAYFTAYRQISGEKKTEIAHQTEIREEVGKWYKDVSVSAEDDSQPVFVRVKAFAPEGLILSYVGEDWTEGEDGWLYYGKVLKASETTSLLHIEWNDAPEGAQEYHIAVIYEAIPAVMNNGEWTADCQKGEGNG